MAEQFANFTEDAFRAPPGNEAGERNARGHELIPNFERGCGGLKEENAYFRSDISPDGNLPAFVEFDHPIAYKEGQFRGYTNFPGLSFEMTVVGDQDQYDAGLVQTTTTPSTATEDHLDRLMTIGKVRGDHAGQMRTLYAHDMLMYVGSTHYKTPEDFIAEVKSIGLSKAFPMGKDSIPTIVPGVTRLFLIHPNAITVEVTPEDADPDDDPVYDTVDGIIGYCHLSRIVYTEGVDGEVGNWVEEAEQLGKLDIVAPMPFVPSDDPRHPQQKDDARQQTLANSADTADTADSAPAVHDADDDLVSGTYTAAYQVPSSAEGHRGAITYESARSDSEQTVEGTIVSAMAEFVILDLGETPEKTIIAFGSGVKGRKSGDVVSNTTRRTHVGTLERIVVYDDLGDMPEPDAEPETTTTPTTNVKIEDADTLERIVEREADGRMRTYLVLKALAGHNHLNLGLGHAKGDEIADALVEFGLTRAEVIEHVSAIIDASEDGR